MPRPPILHVTSVRRRGPFSLRLTFSDGCNKQVNVLPLLRRGAHRRLRDPKEFAKVRLDREWGVPCWSGQLDIAPEALRDLPDESESPRGRRRSRPAARK